MALISLAATTHTKHLTAWHTIDGLFFIAAGLALCIRQRPATKLAGYVLVALAALCKQNFIFVAPLSMFVLGDWRRLRYWIAIVLPGLCYVIYLVLVGALHDALVQLSAHTELFSTGIRRYLVWILVAVIGYLLLKVVSVISSDIRRWATLFVFYWLPLVVAVMSLLFGKLATTSFFLFALLLMLGAASLVSDRASDWSRAVLLVLLTAWSASLSGGYNTPALMAGPILVLLVSQSIQARSDERLVRYSIPALAVIILFCFGVARTKYIYREQPASQLTYSLEGVMPGANRIYTNANTFAFLTDLNRAIELVRAQDKESAILPDLAAYWVQAKQKNPLPAVWPQAEELSSKVLTTRFTEAMEARRNKTIFIVQKVEAKDLASGFVALPNSNYYEVVRYARTHFTKAQETDYFELYR